MYHERKLGKEGEAGVVEGVELPDCKDIDAVIKFQKRMYGLFKNLMPAAGTLNQNFYYPQQEMPKFAPFTLYPERTYRHFDNDYYSSLGHSPYLPAFPPKPYSHLYDDKRNPSPFMRADSFQRTDSNRNDSFQRSDSLSRNDSFLDRPSLFPKLPSQPSQNKFDQPDFDKAFRSAQDYFLTPLAPPPREESIQRGFQAVQEEFEGQLPSKKVKKDAVEVMKR